MPELAEPAARAGSDSSGHDKGSTPCSLWRRRRRWSMMIPASN